MKKTSLVLAFTAVASVGCGSYENTAVEQAEEMPCVDYGAEVEEGLDRTESLTASVAFDADMAPDHVEALFKARDAWRMATSGRANLELYAESGITADLLGKRPNIIVDMNVADLRGSYGSRHSVGVTNYDNDFIVMGKDRYTYNYANTALHELGHFIGLGHSTTPKDIMYHTANNNRTVKISCNDVRAFNKIYGGL